MPAVALASRSLPRRVMPVTDGGHGAPLVHGGQFQTSPPVEDGYGIGTKRDGRAWLQKQLQRLLHFHGRGEKVSFGGCGMGTQFGKSLEIHRQEATGELSFVGLAHCSSPWICPICAPRVGAKRLDDIQKVGVSLLDKGFSYLFLTFTAQHDKDMELAPFLCNFKSALGYFPSTYAYKLLKKKFAMRHYITAFEVTYDMPGTVEAACTGWHPHGHRQYWLERPFLTEEECAEFLKIVSDGWQVCCQKFGLTASREHGVYLESFQEHARKTGLEKPFDEMSKESQEKYIKQIAGYFSKSMGFELTGATRKVGKRGRFGGGRCTPWDLALAAVKGDVHARDRWIEYVYAMRGRDKGGSGFHCVEFSKKLMSVVETAGPDEESDKEAMQGKKGYKVLEFGVDLPVDAWLPAAKQGRLWHLLTVADQAKYDEVEKDVGAACKRAEKGIDILTGEYIGVGRVNPRWGGCDGFPAVQLGGDLLERDQFEKEQEEKARQQEEEEKRVAWQESVYRNLFAGNYAALYESMESLFFARDHLETYGRDADVVLPLAVPWTGCGPDARLLLPGASVRVDRSWSDKKRRYVHVPRIVWH